MPPSKERDDMTAILEVRQIDKTYKNHAVLKDLSMRIEEGDIYGFVGKNGAGKTTLIRVIAGLIDADGGEFSLFGTSNKSKEIHKERRKVCAMVESPSIYPELSAKDNMKMQCLITGSSFDCIHPLLEYVDMAHTGKKRAKDFSLGMRQRLGIAMALVNEPRFMLLDEPINGLDPEGIKQIRELLLKMNKEKGITILISSHILTELSIFANRFGFIDQGKLIKEATIEEIKATSKSVTRVGFDRFDAGCDVLQYLGYSFTKEKGFANVSDHIDLMKLCLKLHDKGVCLTAYEPSPVDLEDYFMDLLGGSGNEIIKG